MATTTKPPAANMIDLEGGTGGSLYPNMMESPELRWGFIRKVYAIVAAQLLLTVAVSAVVVSFDHPIVKFLTTTKGGFACYIVLLLTPFITLIPLFFCSRRHPYNYVLLGIFTISLAFAVGLSCAFSRGKVIFEATILSAVLVVSLSLYTFWGAKRGYDFNFLGPFLFGSLMVLIVFGLIQIFFPMGKLFVMIYGLLAAIIFCGYIVFDTDNLIKRFTYDEYIIAATSLYPLQQIS